MGSGLSSPHCVCQFIVWEIVWCLGGRDTDCRGDYIHPEWFNLDTSRGMETPGLKSLMRFSVIISDYALYVPALLAYTQFVVPAGRKIDKVHFPLELY